jgi:hypothetical protein
MFKRLLPFLDDVFYWAGAALVVAGAYLVYPAAAFFTAGAFCLFFSWRVGKMLSL